MRFEEKPKWGFRIKLDRKAITHAKMDAGELTAIVLNEVGRHFYESGMFMKAINALSLFTLARAVHEKIRIFMSDEKSGKKSPEMDSKMAALGRIGKGKRIKTKKISLSSIASKHPIEAFDLLLRTIYVNFKILNLYAWYMVLSRKIGKGVALSAWGAYLTLTNIADIKNRLATYPQSEFAMKFATEMGYAEELASAAAKISFAHTFQQAPLAWYESILRLIEQTVSFGLHDEPRTLRKFKNIKDHLRESLGEDPNADKVIKQNIERVEQVERMYRESIFETSAAYSAVDHIESGLFDSIQSKISWLTSGKDLDSAKKR